MVSVLFDPLSRNVQVEHPILNKFKFHQQGSLDCFCGMYATINLISFMRNFCVILAKEPSKKEWDAVLSRFSEIASTKEFLGGSGFDGYELLPAVCGALYETGFHSARVSVRAAIGSKKRQSIKEETSPARAGIDLAGDLSDGTGNELAIAAVYECDAHPASTWNIADAYGHWIALIGKKYIPNEIKLGDDDGIVLDSNRGYGLWKLHDKKGLRLKRPRDGNGASEVRVWVYALITVHLDDTDRPKLNPLKLASG